jgi:phosphopantothenoylcysteine decarboxylase/phosphopantothenate--cysteine ligase
MKMLVTAGPTREFLDPVRFLSNRSSGRMGYAIAAAAASRGHEVVLVSGPVSLSPPEGVQTVDVVSAQEMLDAVSARVAWCEALVMCAAVADWRPKVRSAVKLKKRGMSATLELEPNPDILCAVSPLKGGRLFIGFAAETNDVMEEARGKLSRKGLDLIVANDVTKPGAGFEVETNIVTLIPAEGPAEALPLMSKSDVAFRIVAWAEQAHAARTAT